MNRINAIDSVRGICMWIMVYGHLLDWWIKPSDIWFKNLLFAVLEPIGATGFIFVSGISTSLAFKNNLTKQQSSDSAKFAKYVFFLRAIIILIIAFTMNTFSLILLKGSILDIWSWLVLQTIGFSLILSWPFLNNSNLLRILLGIILIAINQVILVLLLPFYGQMNLFGVLYHFLFNPITQYVILIYFGIFLIGTSVGEFIFEFNKANSLMERKALFKSHFYKKSMIFGSIFLLFGLFYAFPNFLIFNTFSSIIYSLGLILVLITLLISKELTEKAKHRRSYRYLFFYSYYSFTIYIGHYILFFLFLDQVNWVMFLILVLGLLNVVFTLLIRTIYVKLGNRASLKTGINFLSGLFAMKLIKRKQNLLK